jgi:hypothetical protein
VTEPAVPWRRVSARRRGPPARGIIPSSPPLSQPLPIMAGYSAIRPTHTRLKKNSVSPCPFTHTLGGRGETPSTLRPFVPPRSTGPTPDPAGDGGERARPLDRPTAMVTTPPRQDHGSPAHGGWRDRCTRRSGHRRETVQEDFRCAAGPAVHCSGERLRGGSAFRPTAHDRSGLQADPPLMGKKD